MKIKKKQQKEIERYIRWCANELGLRDWTFVVELDATAHDLRNIDDHDGDENVWGAACDPVRGRKLATISIGKHVLETLVEDGDLVTFRQTIAHELIHCHFAVLWDQIRLDLRDHFGQTSYDIFVSSAERNMEFGVDAVAEIVAKQLPLIELP